MLRRVALLLLLLAPLWLAPRAGAQDAQRSLDALLAKLAKVEGLSAHFREEKRLSLVAVPLVSEGTIHYQKPRKLARHTLKPSPSSVLLTGDVVRFADAARSETIGLETQPALRMLIDTFVGVLAGDKAALVRFSELSLEDRGPAGWRIKLVPKDPKLLRIVRALAFEGKDTELSAMELVDGHGDVTRTTFSDVRFGRLPEAEAKRAFRLGAGG
jgi:outer membrane lipoprotein-sorting protein